MKPAPLGPGVELIGRDPHGLVALNKPAGVLAHPNAGARDPRALINASYNAERQGYEWQADGVKRWLFLLNRLDSATSGVLLLAEDLALAEGIRALFHARHINKTYVARVFGRIPPGSNLWRDRLTIEKGEGAIRTATGGGIPAEATATTLKIGRGEPITSLLKLKPQTGRSHQLRVQCAARNVPVVGDQTYGDFRRNREFAKATGLKRLFLHSLETKFEYAWKGRQYTFAAKAPLPPEFEAGL